MAVSIIIRYERPLRILPLLNVLSYVHQKRYYQDPRYPIEIREWYSIHFKETLMDDFLNISSSSSTS